jgi:urocanate reductase
MKLVLKKILPAVILAAALAGCSQKGPSLSFKAGTYTGQAQGNGGSVPVTVVFSDTAIKSVTVGENKETKGVADPAIAKIPQAIVKGQTLAVDTVSGATITSKAILAAVTDCVTQAGGDAAALQSKKGAASHAGKAIKETTDIVVIGGGGAGLAAAGSAAQAGAKVILIEKGAALGGNTIRAGGAYNAVDPERQKTVPMDPSMIAALKEIQKTDPATIDADYKDTLVTLQKQIAEYLAGDTSKLFDTVELHTYQTYLGGKRTGLDGKEIHGDYTLVHTVTANSLDALNWVASNDSNTKIGDTISTVLGGLWPRMHHLNSSVGHGFITPLVNMNKKYGTNIMLETKAEELIMKKGRVVGVKAVKADGTKVTLYAKKAVIMATGGYGANPKMAKEYDDYWGCLSDTMPTTNTQLATGDGIIMGKAVGANLVGMGFIQLMPSSHPVTGSLGGGLWTSAENQVFVNKQGKRFVSEYESRDVMAKAALQQPDGMFWIICDQSSAGNPQRGGQNSWGNDINEMIKDGSVLTSDTLEGLAKQIGCDPAVFTAEIAKYNHFCDTGVDTEFGKVKMGEKIDVGPFWATPRKPAIHHTMGGLEINEKAQVISTSGKVIPGFYAAGEVTGGIHAGNRVGGNALPDIMVFGRIAGKNAAAE